MIQAFHDRTNSQGNLFLLLALASCVLLAPWSEAAKEWFSLDRAAVSQGQYWRIWTGQLVHTSWFHLGLNLVGLLCLMQIFGREIRAVNWLAGYLFISPFIAVCWLVADWNNLSISAGYDYVVGLSALLHGLFAFAACLVMQRDRLIASGVILVIGAKLLAEQLYGPSVMTGEFIGMPVAAEMHVYGYVGGICAALLLLGGMKIYAFYPLAICEK